MYLAQKGTRNVSHSSLKKEDYAMKDVTLRQGNQISNLILQQQTPGETVQFLIEKGLLSDVFSINLDNFVVDMTGNPEQKHYDSNLERAQLRNALKIGPRFKVKSRHIQKVGVLTQCREDEIDPKDLESKGIRYLVPDKLRCPWDFYTQVCHRDQPRVAEFFTLDFYKPGSDYHSHLNVPVLIHGAGYINADVNDLIEFADHIRDTRIDIPVVAMNSYKHHSTGSGGFTYTVYPSLIYNPDTDVITFRHIGLKDMHQWQSEYVCLVRH